ncbi:DNA phosphorothioation-dependent restriction protein DptH [Romboutsia sedimentorum]|uniref:DNA phosphorothioation-dependent restriction protein DptH n=1 Tax=Romboutsia sedimentorum TaxID=1368474 RepID=A0ABT7E5L2_9FIRM|nr:DNA phosphorothioation-dependent restriction protein DptH [Romboutsia sedimentorum]MDK2562217.1 DNA phosphorothioation-dependent restriction protein DptH [Romboutsia sedimentorum]
MLNQFYSYLSKNVVKYLEYRNVKSGDKFNIQFEKEEEVKNMYNALQVESKSKKFIYNTVNGSKYETFSIDINGTEVVVAATNEDTTDDFLIRLRNLVGDESSVEFKDSAILFIHNTTLDSLIKGTESFQKEGMPLHTKSLVKDIKKNLSESNIKEEERYILDFALNKMNDSILEDHSSIFQYANILKVLNKGELSKEDYSEFGIFYDENLLEDKTPKMIKERLNENANMFSKVDSIHKYGSPEIELDKDFDAKGIDLLKVDDWKDVEYKEIKLSQERKRGEKIVLLEDIVPLDPLTIWDRAEGDSKAKSRKRNIIIFNNNKLDTVNFEIAFDINIKKVDFKLDKKTSSFVNVNASGRSTKAQIRIDVNIKETTFAKIVYNDGKVKYDFKVCIVSCNENILDKIKTNYEVVIKTKVKMLVSNTDDNKIIINPKGSIECKENITELENSVILDMDEKMELLFDVEMEDDLDFVRVDINYNDSIISIAKEEEKERPTIISGMKIWKLKRENQESFKYLSNNKIAQGTSEYFAKEDFKENLEVENIIIENKAMHHTVVADNFEKVQIDIDEKVQEAYENLINYYKVNNLLPSLAYYDIDLINISKDYLNSILNVFSNIQNEEVLSKQQRNIGKLGTIYRLDGDKEIVLTPLHPINVAYQLMVNKTIEEEEVEESILKLLSSRYLMPYIYKERHSLYKVVDQNHSPEWTYYVDHKMSRYKGSRDYVSKLTREKLDEFIDHFTYLFRNLCKSKIKMKLINLGDCKEALLGIFDYYTRKLNKGEDINNLISLDVYIYGDKNTINAFEEIAFYNSIEDIKNQFNINLKADNYSEEDILNLFRDNVKFYKKDKNEETYEYSHLTFYEMDQDVSITSSSMDDINTGIALNGLLSGVPSMYLKDTYRTGFGSKFANKNQNDLVGVTMKFNSLTKSIGTEDPYSDSLSVTTSIGEKNKLFLNKVYDTSQWVTFIDPKVDLNFFKNDENAKDLLIIHYSDQYTTSSGYDAITVTRRSKQYQVIVEEFLSSKGVEPKEDTVAMLINYFNAINGDWLLRLISSKSQFPREKLSILSAIKISLAYFYHKDITWIPISLEEVLRVSGGAGLKQSNGLFTVKNLTGTTDSYSDDLLLVGIENKDEKVKVHFYPVEVKIGENSEAVIQKAVEQAKKTRNLIEDNLIASDEDSKKFTKLMYRNFMMQLVMVSAEKMKLYNIWNEQNWDGIINSDVRTKLLNDDYEISSDLDKYIGRGSVISFKKNAFFNKGLEKRDEITILELSEQEGYNNIVKDLEAIKEKYIKGHSDFDVNEMLINKYGEYETINIQTEPVKPKITNGQNEGIYTQPQEVAVDIVAEAQPDDRPMQIMFGNRKDNDRPLMWYPTDTEQTLHTNTGIIGTMGTGKTQFTKSLITQMYREQKYNVDGKPLGMLIFDYKGDYIDEEFVSATNANVCQIFHLPYNPLALLIPEKPKPLLPLHTANMLKETISNAFNLGIKQQTLLRDVIMEAYELKGIKKANMNTWDRPAPTINDVCSIYFNREDVKEDSLYAALKNLYEFEIFEPDTLETKNLFQIVDGVTVINLSGYDEAIQNLVVAITLDIFYTQMLVAGESKQENGYRQLNKLVLVDEADNFLSKNFISIKKILKEGRMFGVGTILSTQLLSHFATSENEYQNYILTWIIHNVSDLNNKDVRYIFNTQSKGEEDSIYNKIKSLAKHESLVKIPKENAPIYIKDKAFWELNK